MPAVKAVVVIRPRQAFLAAYDRSTAVALRRRFLELAVEQRPARGACVVLFVNSEEHVVSLSKRSVTLERLLASMSAFEEA